MCVIRKTYVHYLFCVWLSVTVLAGVTMAGPIARRVLVDLANKADTIVVGGVQASEINGTVNATVTVERVLKGSVGATGSISVLWASPSSFPTLRKWSGHGIFYLQGTPSGSWSLLPVMDGDIAWKDTFIATPGSLPDSVRSIAAASLPSNSTAMDEVALELVVATEAGSPPAIDLVAVSREKRSPVLDAAFRRMATKNDPRMMLLGLRGLISQGDPSSLVAIQQNYVIGTGGGYHFGGPTGTTPLLVSGGDWIPANLN